VNEARASADKVPYEFRPAKQVERRMLLELFQRLMEAGFRISGYQYTGMGSFYFVDFILFHRYLGIKKMVSVECVQEIQKRVCFNRPYGNIDIVMGDVADVIPSLSPDRKHILWLDFNFIITAEVIDAIVLAAARLSPGSVLLITVDAEPPGPPSSGPKQWCKYFTSEARDYIGNKSLPRHFARSRLVDINASIIDKAIRQGLAGRDEVTFLPLVNFVYADGHRMLSLGGMIGSQEDHQRLQTLDRAKMPFLCSSITTSPYPIEVPLLTRKERLYLDAAMPCRKKWRPTEFELRAEDVEIYKQIYPYFPVYTEGLL
jgi:hypothetical protein